MFGKKKDKVTLMKKDFHCPVCDLDCTDQQTLDRHIAWAHKELAVTQKTEENRG